MVKIGDELNNKKSVAVNFIKRDPPCGLIETSKDKSPMQFIQEIIDFSPKTREDVSKATGLSHEFVNKIIKYEGFRNKVYKDPIGIKTVGVGHNVQADAGYREGDVLPDEKVYKLLTKDLIRTKKDINNSVGQTKLNKDQSEAVVDLFFNVGASKLQNSKLISSIKNKKFDEAACEFNFISSNGVVMPGLCLRRIDNIDKFCSGKFNSKILKLIKFISSKGEEACNKKIKSAPRAKKNYFKSQKELFIKSVNQIMDRTKQTANKYYVFAR